MPLLLYYTPPPINVWYEPYDYAGIVRDEIAQERRRAEEESVLMLYWCIIAGGDVQ